MKKIFIPFVIIPFLLICCGRFVLAQSTAPRHAPTGAPSIHKSFFGETEGQQIYLYTLRNSNGMIVKLMNYGATITDIIIADKNGEMRSVALGFDSLAPYTRAGSPLLGSVVGRVANRISNKKFTLDGKEYTLTSNIHGGLKGFHKRVWTAKELPGKQEVSLAFTYFSKDGEEGFPGNLTVTALYTLTNDNALTITYTGKTDKATPLVLTNHNYFNLSGGRDQTVLNTEVTIAADRYLEATKDKMPTGKFIDVNGTPYDFTTPRPIGQRIAETPDASGYDHVYALRNATGKLALASTAYEPSSGVVLETRTTEPGLVFFTGNHLSEKLAGRDGRPLTRHGGFCLETQHFPDSPNQPGFPGTILRPGETFRSQTRYIFLVREQ